MALAFTEIEAATKSAENPFFKSKYADLGAIIDAVKPPLVKHGLFFTQRCQPAEGGVCVQTVLHHSGGESLDLGTLFVPAKSNDAQAFGSALSYCRRYSLQTAFGVPTEDDDGNAATKAAEGAGNNHRANQAEARDAPFPQGPAKNKTELKTMGRALWRDVEASGDSDTLEILLADKTNVQLVNQIMRALPDWWDGGHDKNGEVFEGLEDVIARRRSDFEQIGNVTPLTEGAFGG